MRWAGAVVAVLVLAAILVWAYRLGTRDALEIPVIKALEGPARVQPADPGGTRMAHQGLEVNEILGGGEAAQPSETALAPATLPLAAEDVPAGVNPADGAVVELGEPLFEDAPGVTPPAELDGSDPASLAASIDALVEEALAGAGRADPSVPGNVETPPARPRARPEDLPPATEVAVAEPPSRGVATPAGPFRGGAVDPDSLAPGSFLVQLGAFDNRDQAAGQWQRLTGAHGDLLGPLPWLIQEVEQNGRTFFRLRVAGFADANEQRSMCVALIARGVDCIAATKR
ncbi:MAG: SPOR domain-containing protein [Pseudomonadota bacterium]